MKDGVVDDKTSLKVLAKKYEIVLVLIWNDVELSALSNEHTLTCEYVLKNVYFYKLIDAQFPLLILPRPFRYK